MPRLTVTQWLIVIIASIGFCFDIYEILMLPLILKDITIDLAGIRPGTPEFGYWVRWMILLPGILGGVFGLIGGNLTDRFGRRRMLVFSILLYAFASFATGFATSLVMVLVLRCLAFIGICLEFVAAISWLSELFPHPRQREMVLGWTQAFSSLGGLLAAIVYGLCVQYQASLPSIAIPGFLEGILGSIEGESQNKVWRYALMSGLIPAFPLIVIRPFLPESPAWHRKKEAGQLQRPSYGELFRPEYRRTTVVATVMMACCYGAAFGAIQQMPQIVKGVPEVKAAVAEVEAPPAKGALEGEYRAALGKTQEIGGLTGRILLAILAVVIVNRRWLVRTFLLPGLLLMPVVFGLVALNNLTLFYIGLFLAGLVTVAQFSFWGNYLPRVYPVRLRGTGSGFAANVGGRIFGTAFYALTATVAGLGFWGDVASPTRFAYTAAAVGFFVFVLATILSFFLPDPRSEEELS